jgi:hypothetical protein
MAPCDSNTISQYWWWSGQRFRNLWATEINYSSGVCLYVGGGLTTCTGEATEWTWNTE